MRLLLFKRIIIFLAMNRLVAIVFMKFKLFQLNSMSRVVVHYLDDSCDFLLEFNLVMAIFQCIIRPSAEIESYSLSWLWDGNIKLERFNGTINCLINLPCMVLFFAFSFASTLDKDVVTIQPFIFSLLFTMTFDKVNHVSSSFAAIFSHNWWSWHWSTEDNTPSTLWYNLSFVYLDRIMLL